MIRGTAPTYRLLDSLTGWEFGLQLPFCQWLKKIRRETSQFGHQPGTFTWGDTEQNRGGLRLDLRTRQRVPRQWLTQAIPPAWLAQGSAERQWFLCGIAESDGSLPQPVIRFRDPCTDAWRDFLPNLEGNHQLHQPVAIAHGWGRLAVLDRRDASIRLFVWSIPDGRLTGTSEFPVRGDHLAVTVAPWREIVAIQYGRMPCLCCDRFDLSAQQRRSFEPELKTETKAPPVDVRIGSDHQGTLILAIGRDERGAPEPLYQLLAIRPGLQPTATGHHRDTVLAMEDVSATFAEAPESIQEKLGAGGVYWEQNDCVGLDISRRQDPMRLEAISRSGQLVPRSYQPPIYPSVCGEVILGPIASDLGRCQWHRVRAEVDCRDAGEFQIDVQSSDSSEIQDLDPEFWQTVDADTDDFLITQPATEYLFLRVRLVGQIGSPMIRRLRIDFPRATSLDQLPAIYRQDPRAEEFTARFLSLFDAEIENLDRCIEELPAIVDIDSASTDQLPWLARLLAVGLADSRDESRQKQILLAAPELHARRGTSAGLRQALGLLVGLEPGQIVIRERAVERDLGAISHNAVLGKTRLFGKRNARLRLGRSALGIAGLNTYGNPDEDPFREDANRFDVLLPPFGPDPNALRDNIESVVNNLKPAHTQHTVRVGGQGFTLGHQSVVGIDTQFVAPTETKLASPTKANTLNAIKLGEGILRPGPHRPTRGLNLGVASNLGIHTSLE